MEPIQEVPVVPELLTPAPAAEVPVSAPAEIEVSVAPDAATITLPAAIESSVVEVAEPHVYINGRDYGVDGLTLDYNKE